MAPPARGCDCAAGLGTAVLGIDGRVGTLAVGKDGALSAPRVVASYGAGTFPDGLAADAEGGLWITSIVSNRVIRVTADGRQELWVEDCDPDFLQRVEDAFLAETMGRPELDTPGGKVLRNISSLAFRGPDLARATLGCLLGDKLAEFAAPVAGQPPVHWSFDVSPIAARRASS